jgi:gliding motility-associated-like protein
MKKIKLISFGLFLNILSIQSQTIDASPETQTICSGGTATLSAVINPAGASGMLTDTYAISSAPYAPDPLTAGTSVSLTDDNQTGLLPIGFSFCYFGNTYTNFIIGSNNWIGFQTGETSTWVTAAIPNATGSAPRNTIMGAWQDINPGVGGTVKYAIYGTAPFRRLSVSWNNVPMFSCTGQLYSSQIIIYETTNIIETHIANKSLCLTWNSGNAVHGLHNSTGTVAFVVPGRNNTQWTVANEATRFTPNGVPSYTINWYILPANTLIGTGPTITVTPPISPQYYYAEVLSNACVAPAAGTNTDTVVVLTNNVPVDAGVFSTFCIGSSVGLSGTAPTGVNFSWSPSASLSDPTIINPLATPGGTTTYTLSVTDGIGCVGSDTVTLAASTITASAGANVSICLGSSTVLTATGGSFYSWSPAIGLSNPAIANPVASPTATTTYTVTANQGLCTATSLVTVTVNPLPLVDGGAAPPICNGASENLSATGALSYVWSPGVTLSSTIISNPISSPTTTTTYTVIGTDGNGCSASDSITVIVNPLPTIDAGASISICPGTNTTLNATGGISYLWSPSGSLDNPAISNPIASPTSITTYTVVGTDASGCSSSDVVSISLSGIIVTASTSSTSICTGSSTSLSALGATSYSWSPSGTLSSSTLANPIASPTSSTTYTVVGTSSSGCLDTAFVTVNVNSLPVITVGPSDTICVGSTTSLSASGAVGYAWSPAGSLSGATTATPVSSAAGTTTYTVVGTDINGCSSTNSVTVTVNSLPVATATSSASSACVGSPVTLAASGGGTYSWLPSSSLSSSTVSNPTATPSSTTTYTVTVASAAGCTATSSVTLTINPIPVATTSADVVICNGASTVITATGGGTYFWSPSAGLSSTVSATPSATPISTTTYTVVVSNGSCNNTATVTVTVNSTLSMTTPSSTNSTCGNADGTIMAGAVTGGGAPFTYSLNGGISQSSTTFIGLSSGTYTLTVTDNAGCTFNQTVVVNSVLGVIASFTASPSSGTSPLTVTLSNSSNGASDYLWDFGNGTSSILTNPSVVYTENGTYNILLIAYNGSFACSDTTTVTINVFDEALIVVPNVFTPNGDLTNDLFVVHSQGIKELTGTIFNRWGNKIYEWNGSPTIGWDGKHNGKEAEDGVYFYVIKAFGFDGKEYDASGFVQLLNK